MAGLEVIQTLFPDLRSVKVQNPKDVVGKPRWADPKGGQMGTPRSALPHPKM